MGIVKFTKSPTPVTFKVDLAPRVNVYWRMSGSRLHLSKEAKDYKAYIGWLLLSERLQPFPLWPLFMDLTVYRKQDSGDADARIKSTQDAFQHDKDGGERLYADDKQIKLVTALSLDDPDGVGFMIVTFGTIDTWEGEGTEKWINLTGKKTPRSRSLKD